jgi:hypothetical protein
MAANLPAAHKKTLGADNLGADKTWAPTRTTTPEDSSPRCGELV